VREFKMMVRALHAAGLEVILDVVYNHTAEGNHLGPTLSLRGIDNTASYRLQPHDARFYQDFTGCGNTLNMRSPRVLQLIMDSLRYWVQEMHVDGFRFDLASALARELHAVDKLGAFFDIIHQDPVLSQVKLIAEPWDLGEGGYQVGNFPTKWTEWNGKYRDTVRRFWRGDGGVLSELATRLAGSSDLYEQSGRRPYASVNFITAHDGFTLADLVAYNQKHNEANGENNRDGTDDNMSWNCGAEGASNDPAIAELRRRQRRNLMLTLMVSQGVPMLSHGDEVGRTQQGNNNAYCHDSGLTWMPWNMPPEEQAFYDMVARLLQLRADQPVLRRRRFLDGRREGATDVFWLRPEGGEMTPEAWHDGNRRAIGILLDGQAILETDAYGERIVGDTLFIALNADPARISFTLPAANGIPFQPPESGQSRWELMVDTAHPNGNSRSEAPGAKVELVERSAAIFKLT
jgi:glycogen operon protein